MSELDRKARDKRTRKEEPAMIEYRRATLLRGIWFFTMNLAEG
jgi:hypothetical protein